VREHHRHGGAIARSRRAQRNRAHKRESINMENVERKSRIPTAAEVLAQQKEDHGGSPGTAVAPVGPDPFAAYGAAATRHGKLLKFTRGDFLAGQNNELVPLGTKMIANMEEATVGWQRWENNRPTTQHMGRIADHYKPPARRDLGDLDEGLWERDDEGKPRNPWQYTSQVPMCQLEDGEQYLFTTSSDGGNKAIGALCADYAKRRGNHPNHHPIITLGWGDYPHSIKSRGRIKFPVFQIVGWTPTQEETSEGNGSAGDVSSDPDGDMPF
jgi:hypothetical protein